MRIKITCLLLSLLAVVIACDDGSQANALGAGSSRVVIVDQGMDMPLGAVHAPAGWTVQHDISTNLQTAEYARYLLDVKGPPGLFRGLGLVMYNHALGQGFEATAESVVLRGLRGFENIEFGEIEVNARRMAQSEFKQAQTRVRSAGMDLEAVQAEFRATANGRPIAGRAEVDHTRFMSGDQHTGGMIFVSVLISTPDQLAELTRMADKMVAAFEPNPEYDGARSRVIDAVAARSAVAHQQRMRSNQASFDAHQQRMRQNSAANDARNQQWLQDFRGGGAAGSSGSNYSNHDRYIDSIHEQSSFNDPDSGQRKTIDGQYDRWATDGLGNYIGSDNPSFDPKAFDGNFQEIEPLN